MEKVTQLQESGRQLVYFAAERTLLSWMRSALAVMALGFVIDRFGFTLQQTSSNAASQSFPDRVPFWLGTLLVLLGVLMMLVAAWRYWRFARRYRRQHITEAGHGLAIVIAFSFIVAILGAVIVAVLLTLAA